MKSFKVAGIKIDFETAPDLFSPKGIDMGTELLISCIPKFEYATALDWGCGWGGMSLWLGKNNPKANVIGLDSDIAAVKMATSNAKTNRLFNTHIIASHGYDDIPSSHIFDLIVSNPPTHRGREVVDSMISESKAHLAKGGTILLVVEARIKPWVARQLKIEFGNYRIVKRSPKHVVVMAQK